MSCHEVSLSPSAMSGTFAMLLCKSLQFLNNGPYSERCKVQTFGMMPTLSVRTIVTKSVKAYQWQWAFYSPLCLGATSMPSVFLQSYKTHVNSEATGHRHWSIAIKLKYSRTFGPVSPLKCTHKLSIQSLESWQTLKDHYCERQHEASLGSNITKAVLG